MKTYTDKDKQNLEYGFAILNDNSYYSAEEGVSIVAKEGSDVLAKKGSVVYAKKGSVVYAEEGSLVINESDGEFKKSNKK